MRRALIAIGILLGSAVVAHAAGTFYSFYGTGDIISTAAEYRFTGKVTIGGSTLQSSDRLLVNGPVRLSDGGTQPTCSSTYKGMFWFEESCSGSKDCVQVCAKDSGATYAWRTIY